MMNATQTKAVAKLREQQRKFPDSSAPYGVACQLIGICQRDPRAAEIILADLDNPDMDIAAAERQIHALADKKHKESKSGAVCVTSDEADAVLRKFYGLPDAANANNTVNANSTITDAGKAPICLSLVDFL